jgi:ABC-type transporter Mla MlaB component
MLKIEPVETDGRRIALRLAGEVHGPWVSELRRVAYTALSSGAKLTLDLGEVLFADHSGVALLGELANHDVSLVNCSSFIAELLRMRR